MCISASFEIWIAREKIDKMIAMHTLCRYCKASPCQKWLNWIRGTFFESQSLARTFPINDKLVPSNLFEDFFKHVWFFFYAKGIAVCLPNYVEKKCIANRRSSFARIKRCFLERLKIEKCIWTFNLPVEKNCPFATIISKWTDTFLS